MVSAPRCRGRWKKLQVAKLLVNLLLVVYSFLALGSQRWCLASRRTGVGLSEVQGSRLRHLLALAKQWCRSPCQTSSRCKVKLQGLLEIGLQMRGAVPGHRVRAPPPLAVMPFLASRVIFCEKEAHFDPIYHLLVFEAVANLDPSPAEREKPFERGLRPMRQAGSLAEIVDVSDFYLAFDASPAKARANVLARKVPTHLMQHAGACAARRAELGRRCVICVGSLLMGDLGAIDFAHAARESVPQFGGSLADAVRALGRSFEAAREQCACVVLGAADDERVTGPTSGVALSAELQVSGRLGAERLRRAGLALLSSGVVARGISAGALLGGAVASWVRVLGFRRPAMCLLGAVFRALPEVPRDDGVVELTSNARQELMLAPTLVTNLKAKVVSKVVCSDASPSCMASVVVDVAQPIVREVWRHRDQRRWHAQLSSQEVAYLRAHKRREDRAFLQNIDAELGLGANVLRGNLLEVFDVLEVCGAPAPWSSSHAAVGLGAGPRVDIEIRPLWDVRPIRIMERIRCLMINDRVVHVHCAPPCATFSLARQPRLRSPVCNVLLFRALHILWTVCKHGRHGALEHPAGAYAWHMAPLRWLFGKPECGFLGYGACACGAPFQKPTRLGLVRGGHLQFLARPCVHGSLAHRRALVGAARAAAAAACAELLCAALAELTRAQLAAEAPLAVPEPPAAASSGRLEQPFVNDLLRCCQWRGFCCEPSPPAARVNRLEVCARLKARERAAWEAGNVKYLDERTRVPRQRRAESEWCRLALKLVLTWALMDFDNALCYPGEGSVAAAPLSVMCGLAATLMGIAKGARVAGERPAVRPAVDLRLRPQTGAQTACAKQLLLAEFESWLLALEGGSAVAFVPNLSPASRELIRSFAAALP
ncbi:unnamed protein product, partial [Prorocentrum cordatum]